MLTTEKMTGQKNAMPPGAFLLQLCRETERETEREKEKAIKRRLHGELRRIGSLFVVLKTRLMKMDGPQYDVRLKMLGSNCCLSRFGHLEDYYTCAATLLNWVL